MGLGGAVFDTNILIDFLNDQVMAREEFDRSTRHCISQVTWIEVMAEVTAGSEAAARVFLGTFEILGLTTEVAEQAVLLRRSRRHKLPDAMILATALSHNLIFVTRNTRDFQEGPMIRIPYCV
jgi:predicted nucleic acid-binding protein